jgi:hypothetical protein
MTHSATGKQHNNNGKMFGLHCMLTGFLYDWTLCINWLLNKHRTDQGPKLWRSININKHMYAHTVSLSLLGSSTACVSYTSFFRHSVISISLTTECKTLFYKTNSWTLSIILILIKKFNFGVWSLSSSSGKTYSVGPNW